MVGTSFGYGCPTGTLEYRTTVVCEPGRLCCVTPDSSGELVPALHDYGVCYNLLCPAGHQCMQGIDSSECSSDVVAAPDGGTDASIGDACGRIHCTPRAISSTCGCLDEARSHCSC